MKKKINFKKILIYYIIFGVAILLPATFCPTDYSNEHQTRGVGADWNGVVYRTNAPYGYRIYITNSKGEIQKNLITNLINYSDSNYYPLSNGLHIRKDGYKSEYRSWTQGKYKIDSNYVRYGAMTFNNILNGSRADFDDVLVKKWSLKKVSEGSFFDESHRFWDYSTDKPMKPDKIIQVLNEYGRVTGLNKPGVNLGDFLDSVIVKSKSGEKYFLVAEPIFSLYNQHNSTGVTGTAIELLYYASGYDGASGADLSATDPNGQNNTFLCRMFNPYFLYRSGAGYNAYDSRYNNSDWSTYCSGNIYSKWDEHLTNYYHSELFKDIRNVKNGIGLTAWALNELFDTECSSSRVENCKDPSTNQYFKNGCCSCDDALTLYKEKSYIFTDRLSGAYNLKKIKETLASAGYKNFPNSCTSSGGPPTPPPEEEDQCIYTLNTNNVKQTTKITLPSSCSTDGFMSGTVDNSIDWDCVFKSSNDSDSTVKEEYYTTENEYCAFYCTETVTYSLPGSDAYTSAGRYITVGSSSGRFMIGPVIFSSTKNCSVTSAKGKTDNTINYKAWIEDFEKKNIEYEKAWDLLQIEKKKEEAFNSSYSDSGERRSERHSCSEREEGRCSAFNCTFTDKKDGHQWSVYHANGLDWTESKLYEDHGCNNKGVDYTCDCQCTAHSEGSFKTYCSNVANYEHGKESYVLHKYVSETRSYSGRYYSWSGRNEYWEADCGHRSGNSLSYNVGSAQRAFDKARDDREEAYNKILMCNNYSDNNKDFEPKLQISYNDVQYAGTYDLKGSKYGSSTTMYSSGTYTNPNPATSDGKYTYSKDIRGNSATFDKWVVCPTSGQQCYTSTKLYPNNDAYVSSSTVTYVYKLQDGLYQYILKPSGKSVSSKPTSGNYVNVGISNLPIHYTTPSGRYNYSITTLGLGTNDKIGKHLFGGVPFDGKVYSVGSTYKYDCSYKVVRPSIICTKNSDDPACPKCDGDNCGGTDVIYRTISLTSPFPGESGANRNPGHNWYGIDPRETSVTIVNKYITNNRGENTYDVYKLDPMYEIDLTPALMKTIKKYNSDQNKKTITYYGETKVAGLSDFELVCKKTTGGAYTQCTSKVLRTWGVKGCGIKGTGKTKCGNTVAWEMNS